MENYKWKKYQLKNIDGKIPIKNICRRYRKFVGKMSLENIDGQFR